MKKYLFVMLLVMVMVLPAGGALATAPTSPSNGSTAGSLPESTHINAFRTDRIIGSPVINLEGKRIGTINDLVIDINTGDIMYAVLDFGGFLGFDNKLFAVPWQSLTSVPAEGIFIIDQSKAKLEKAPGFDKNNWPDIGDRTWGAGIYDYYRHHVPKQLVAGTPKTAPNQKAVAGYEPYRGYATQPYPYPSVWPNVYEGMFNPQKIVTVSGQILRIENYEETRLVIYTDAKKPVLVALGPTGFLESQPNILRKGNKVTVTGSMVTVDDTPLLIATKVKEGHKELDLRDNEGHPIWIGWKQIK
jgi:sporulation protein YlmC with PRC-barrel domain